MRITILMILKIQKNYNIQRATFSRSFLILVENLKYLLVEKNQYNLTLAVLQPRLIWLKESFNQKENFKILVEKLVEKDEKF